MELEYWSIGVLGNNISHAFFLISSFHSIPVFQYSSTLPLMKGILICGGRGTRLLPLTENTHKSLLHIGGKPLVVYPLQVLLDAGITDIMLITGPEHAGGFMQFLGSGSAFACNFTYRIQDEPKGIAHALAMAESFADGQPVCALLGDNIFQDNLSKVIHNFSGEGGHLFLKEVPDPERFGVAELDSDRVISMEEKPKKPKSNLAVTG
jgi:glucose-1-phosphate thymidylyltransferase